MFLVRTKTNLRKIYFTNEKEVNIDLLISNRSGYILKIR
jgi:hypothetical protein